MIKILPKYGDKRIVKKYAYLPSNISLADKNMSVRIWLEYYYIEQEYGVDYTYRECWVNKKYHLGHPDKKELWDKDLKEIIDGK